VCVNGPAIVTIPNLLLFIPTAVEWIGEKEGKRNVKVKFSSSDRKIYVQNENGKNLRTIDLSFLTVPDRRGHNYVVRVALSADDQFRMINIRVPKEYDLVRCTRRT